MAPAPRKSISRREDYKTAGAPWDVRGAFVEGMEYATAIADFPIINGADFNIYSGGNFLAKTLELVWAGQIDSGRGHGQDPGRLAEGSRRGLICLERQAKLV